MGHLSDGEIDLWVFLLPANIINVIVMTFMLITVWIYNNRRHHFPIKGRGSHPVLLVAVLFLAILLSLAIRGPHVPCIIDLMIYIPCSQCACGIYLYRVAVLLARHHIASAISFGNSTRDLLQRRQQKRSCLQGGKYCNLLDTRKWNWILAIYGFVIFCLVFAIAAAEGDNWNCAASIITLISNGALIVILIPILTYMGCKLRKYPSDGRHVSAEFRFVAFFMVAALIIYTGVSQGTDVPYSSIYFLDVVAVGLMCSSMCYPIYLTYRYQRRSRAIPSPSTRGSLSCSIEALLKNEAFRVAFLAHLKLEFNAESLIFWQTVSLFKAQGERSQQEIITEIVEIMDTFVGRNAPYQLNVSDDCVSLTRATFQKAQDSGVGLLDVFDTLVNEVVALMKNDPLPRFLRTPAGREFITRREDSSGSGGAVVVEVLKSALIPHHSPVALSSSESA